MQSKSVLQTDLDKISGWSKDNNMNLNTLKCEEMLVCSLKCTPDLAPLLNGVSLEKVASHKVLNTTIMDHLKWNKSIDEIISKASKRLHIIGVLKMFFKFVMSRRDAQTVTPLF